jgi:hypothetical protein
MAVAQGCGSAHLAVTMGATLQGTLLNHQYDQLLRQKALPAWVCFSKMKSGRQRGIGFTVPGFDRAGPITALPKIVKLVCSFHGPLNIPC